MVARIKRPLFRVEKGSRGSESWLADNYFLTRSSMVMLKGGIMTRITYFVYIVDAIIKSIIMNVNKVQNIASA